MINKANEPDALVQAAFDGDVDQVRVLLQQGMDLNERDELGQTALITAAERGYSAVAELLVSQGADVSLSDADGNTALDFARLHDNRSLADLLLANGAIERAGPSPVETFWDDYFTARAALNQMFLDDRMLVIEVERTIGGPVMALERNRHWSAVTRRNVRGYPPVRIDNFQTRWEAVDYLKSVAPSTPLVSLGGISPNPTPSWDEFQEWLAHQGLERLSY